MRSRFIYSEYRHQSLANILNNHAIVLQTQRENQC